MYEVWEHFTVKPNWRVCERLYDITANAISAGIFPIYRAWSYIQMMFFTIAPLHTHVRSNSNRKTRYYVSKTTGGVWLQLMMRSRSPRLLRVGLTLVQTATTVCSDSLTGLNSSFQAT